MKISGWKLRFCLILVCLGLMSTGCASSKGAYRMTAPVDELKISKYSEVNIDMTCSQGVPVGNDDMERIKSRIIHNIPSECPDRFKTIQTTDPGPNTMKATVNLTRYDEGNAFARAMLAGLGQMHIDATVTMTDYLTGQNIGNSEVSKTFAWGGIYGGATGIKDIEDAFGRAVAASLTGKSDETQKLNSTVPETLFIELEPGKPAAWFKKACSDKMVGGPVLYIRAAGQSEILRQVHLFR